MTDDTESLRAAVEGAVREQEALEEIVKEDTGADIVDVDHDSSRDVTEIILQYQHRRLA